MSRELRPEDVRADLLYLRKGPGYTDDRLRMRKALVTVLGGSIEPVPVLRERLESAVHSLRDDEAALLLEIYGLIPATQALLDLGARRDAAGRRLGIKREAVADRDTAAVENLLRQLITGWYPKSPTGIRIPESHNGFVQSAVHTKTYVRNGRHLETLRMHRLFALFDNIEYIGISAAWPEPPIVVGDDFVVRTKETANGFLHQFWHKDPMQRGNTYDLRYRIVNPDPEERGWLTEDSIAFHEPTRFANFEVAFMGDAPSIAWSFQGLTTFERPGSPTKQTLVQIPRGGDSIRVSFDGLHGGLYCGVAWEW